MKQVDLAAGVRLFGGVRREVEDTEILKGVSRSFFLSLRLLPAPMRRGAALGYLLARTSDTVADTVGIPLVLRKEWLSSFRCAVAEVADAPRWPIALLNAISDLRERRLLESSGEIFERLKALPLAEQQLVQEVLDAITAGQLSDLTVFAEASEQRPIALRDAVALETYTWQVAGSVGAFWTKLGFATLGSQFSLAPEAELIERGAAYGKGLQVVNILRDVAADLAMGRCYLPVEFPRADAALLAAHAEWLGQAREWVAAGPIYARQLRSWRLRVATVLPALLAKETLKLLDGASWAALQQKPKVPRWRVYLTLVRAFLRTVI